MLQVNEIDLELLEQLLDGEMLDVQADALRRRIADEPALSQAFQRLREEREVRRQMWRALEPEETEVNALVSNVRSAVRKDELWTKRYRSLRYVSGLAACIVLGFFFGRYIPTGTPSHDRANTGVIFNNPSSGAMEVMHPRPDGYKVQLTDNFGRVIAEQRFNTLDEAREFTEDLGRMQRRPQQPMRVNDTILIKGEF